MKSKLSKGWSIFWCIVFAVVSVVFMLPLIWMLLSSFKPEGLIMGRPEWLIPRQWTLEGYSTLLKKSRFSVFCSTRLFLRAEQRFQCCFWIRWQAMRLPN